MRHEGVWRVPDEESVGIYPGLTLHDGRVSGSITLGQSRLPAWAFGVDFPDWDGYASDQAEPGAPHYGVSKDDLARFIYYLLEQRGEIGRLLLELADAERREYQRSGGPPWWCVARSRRRVLKQLRRCEAALEAIEGREDGDA